MNVAGIGVLKSAEQGGNAQKFIDFLLERPQQEYFAQDVGEYPLVAGVAQDPSLPPLQDIQAPDVDLQGFDDIRRHQAAVAAALQPALARMLDDMAPEAIAARSAGGLVTSKKARAWETYVERWDAKAHPHENGMLDVFLACFAEAYEDAVRQTGG